MATRFSQYRAVTPALVEQRGEPRHRVLVTPATVRAHGDEADEATLRDLSVYGCRLSCPAEYPQGERLWLRFNGSMPIAASVVWNDGEQVGCRFDAPIERSLMRALTLVIC
ncbi:PilZ domain-containing protein [Sphingomonas xinjiangensis]|uniref:PilZ domain-containing protein n=1 Tax=Sphingomonas xinjiangensis TaxID=643568 RepID=A0A840YGU6_9SPHN|nr:PilZ domain-containing protein [Sphingomonas xinjiangensis]MBB5711535.1 hypothetical protein [Sphingomonas xinjiangensis]